MIEVNELRYTYTGAAVPAVDGLCFDVQHGEVFGFLGPSGAGKSTTQKVLIGLLAKFEGCVRVMGQTLSAWRSDYYERIGVSFETPNHFLKLTALENLRYFRSLYGGRTQEPQHLLDVVGLGGDGHMFVSQFSKGMKNRLSVARALLNAPDLIFLDEPTVGLDPVNARRIKDLIVSERQAGKTIFLTTHDMSLADEICDRLAFIVDGRLALIDSPRALKLRYGKRSVRVEYGSDDHLETREFPLDNLVDNDGFLTLLRSGTVRTLHTQEATLEDIFIQITGRELS